MSNRKYVEEPDIDRRDENGDRFQQRTVEQQERVKNVEKNEKREQGLDTNRSRSSSRRERRKRVQKAQEDGKHMNTAPLTALEEADANGEAHTMQPFERIGPDSTSMDGPVTFARAERGEIPTRGANGKQPYYKTPKPKDTSVSGPRLDSRTCTDGLDRAI